MSPRKTEIDFFSSHARPLGLGSRASIARRRPFPFAADGVRRAIGLVSNGIEVDPALLGPANAEDVGSGALREAVVPARTGEPP